MGRLRWLRSSRSEREALALGEQIGAAASAEIPLPLILRAASLESPDPRTARGLTRIAERLEAGVPLEDALASHKGDVPAFLGDLLSATHGTEAFSETIIELVHGEQKERTMRLRLSLALLTPTLQLVLALIVTGLLLRCFQQFIEAFTTNSLPIFPLQILTWFLKDGYRGVAYLAIGLAIMMALTRLLMGRKRWEFVIANMPMLGAWWHGRKVYRWLSVLGLLIERRVSLERALRTSAEATGSAYLASYANVLAVRVEQGQTLHNALASGSHLPPVVHHWLSWGETHNDLARGVRQAVGSLEDSLIQRQAWIGTVAPQVLMLVSAWAVVTMTALCAGAAAVTLRWLY